ncbi:serine/threonine-protein kinase [Streptomyces diastatochromogenes]|uniref:Serine/threonine protein kinase n=1 Tax=Streptomyces diastatochromogenes TaxID=42236 RepID=A0A233SPK6_STRDA|nr:serine/threonine-protein kinase [Streptomyces diastatochromogenes]OXY97574.1 serine/threonine protein kinase [Streptomyces diastatochromogenes]
MDKLGPGDPQRIGAYRLLARLGAGGMGHVYLARSDRGRTVAVKLVREELAEQEEFRARFRQEVQAARRVGGYWTAPVLDADTEAAVPWVATGYVAGPSLQQVVSHDHGALPERSVRILAAGLAHALTDIHAAGIVHRDLKPSNVLVTIDGPRVIDFGIARAMETMAGDGLTRTGSLVGSPGFMAPEQVRGDRITPACDVFCLGSVLAYASTGVLPFGGANSGVHALMFRIAQEEPDLEGVPEGIADLVRDCLKKDPASRPSLERILERTGAGDTVAGGRSRDPWLPGALVAQLGRGAVQLLDAEDPSAEGEGRPSAGSGFPPAPPVQESSSGAGGPGGVDAPSAGAGAGSPAPGVPAPAWVVQQGGGGSPEHAAAADDGGAPPPSPGIPSQPGPSAGSGAPVNHLPTMVSGQTPPPAPPPAAPGYGAPGPYGYPQQPQQHPQPPAAAYGYPQQPYNPYGGGGLGSTPPYGPPPVGVPQQPERRNGRSTALLVVIALVVALGAGGSVYALMNRGGDDDKGGGTVSPAPTVTTTAPGGGSSPAPNPTTSAPSPSAPTDGAIPDGYLGTWETTIDNSNGSNTRQLTIQQGKVGDTVLTLVADGPTDGGGTYHCVFEAQLTEEPGTDGPLEIGPSSVTSGEPISSCSPGEATEVTLLSDGRLKRVKKSGGESLTYTKQ